MVFSLLSDIKFHAYIRYFPILKNSGKYNFAEYTEEYNYILGYSRIFSINSLVEIHS